MTYEKYALGKLKALTTGTTYVKPPKGVQSDKKAVATSVAFGGHAGNSTSHPDGKKVALKYTAEEIELGEVKNHMGETEYTSFASWKKAAKAVDADVWFDGDKDIAQAICGPKPFKKGESKSIGEWDGEVGSIYKKISEAEDLDEAFFGAKFEGYDAVIKMFGLMKNKDGSFKSDEGHNIKIDSEGQWSMVDADGKKSSGKSSSQLKTKLSAPKSSVSEAVNRARALAGLPILKEGEEEGL